MWTKEAVGHIAMYFARSNFFIKYFKETEQVVVYILENEKLKFYTKYESYGKFLLEIEK